MLGSDALACIAVALCPSDRHAKDRCVSVRAIKSLALTSRAFAVAVKAVIDPLRRTLQCAVTEAMSKLSSKPLKLALASMNVSDGETKMLRNLLRAWRRNTRPPSPPPAFLHGTFDFANNASVLSCLSTEVVNPKHTGTLRSLCSHCGREHSRVNLNPKIFGPVEFVDRCGACHRGLVCMDVDTRGWPNRCTITTSTSVVGEPFMVFNDLLTVHTRKRKRMLSNRLNGSWIPKEYHVHHMKPTPALKSYLETRHQQQVSNATHAWPHRRQARLWLLLDNAPGVPQGSGALALLGVRATTEQIVETYRRVRVGQPRAQRPHARALAPSAVRDCAQVHSQPILRSAHASRARR